MRLGLQKCLAPRATELEPELITQSRPERRDQDHRAKLHITAMRRDPGQKDSGLAFEKRARENKIVSVFVQEALKRRHRENLSPF